jgi:hypothetical protein
MSDAPTSAATLQLSSPGRYTPGFSGPQYGLLIDGQSDNQASEVYGIHVTAKHGVGGPSYGVYGITAPAYNSYGLAHGVHGTASLRAEAHSRASGVTGIYGEVSVGSNSSIASTSESAAGYFKNNVNIGASNAYGVVCETVEGPVTTTPLVALHNNNRLFSVAGNGNVTVNAGNLLVGTSTDNGVDRLQVNGNVKATTFKGIVERPAGNDFGQKIERVITNGQTIALRVTPSVYNNDHYGVIIRAKYSQWASTIANGGLGMVDYLITCSQTSSDVIQNLTGTHFGKPPVTIITVSDVAISTGSGVTGGFTVTIKTNSNTRTHLEIEAVSNGTVCSITQI